MAIQKGPGRVFHACHLPPLSELPTSLEKGETDLAIGMININGQGIRSVTLFEEEYVAIVGSGHLCLPKTIDDLKQARLVVSAPAATYGKDLNDNLARAGLIDNIVLRLSHFARSRCFFMKSIWSRSCHDNLRSSYNQGRCGNTANIAQTKVHQHQYDLARKIRIRRRLHVAQTTSCRALC